ncbi:DUF6708 domain-containing protein [Aquabacterium sp.]|uniref:DUF6708 domain-containing protein n=1 Tax=Aquabacterium sp. TaxID=1872578 RepID=UPI0024892B4E|nr:DUF6708 domain-containing protein [Aquabacterium sp.]MDI1258277.1 hypothetical protein [Aquabacterium sp.]
MDYTGLTTKYPVNRPLTDAERQNQLRQAVHVDSAQAFQLSVVRVDEQCLEIVDKYYEGRGALTAVVLLSASLVLVFFAAMLSVTLETPGRLAKDWLLYFGLAVIASPLFAALSWALSRDAFTYTHFPIRFDRMAQMVHVFRRDGTVLSKPWKDVFFCLAHGQSNVWNVRGHVLATDGLTVLETFALSATGGNNDTGKRAVLGFWEMVRCYMAEGPQQATKLVTQMLPIEHQRETLSFGFHLMHAQSAGAPRLFVLVYGLLCLVWAPARWLAMRTSHIPRWPVEVVASFGKTSASPPGRTNSKGGPAAGLASG